MCPSCGTAREASDRHVRRGAIRLCNLCRFPARRLPPTDRERRFWLKRFSDDEISMMATALFGSSDLLNIKAWRERLKVDEP